jgi:hypothetical protein
MHGQNMLHFCIIFKVFREKQLVSVNVFQVSILSNLYTCLPNIFIFCCCYPCPIWDVSGTSYVLPLIIILFWVLVDFSPVSQGLLIFLDK